MKKYSDLLNAVRDLENSLKKREHIREAYFSLPIKKDEYNVRPPAREAEEDRKEIILKIDEQILPLFLKDVNSRKASVVLSYSDTGRPLCFLDCVLDRK